MNSRIKISIILLLVFSISSAITFVLIKKLEKVEPKSDISTSGSCPNVLSQTVDGDGDFIADLDDLCPSDPGPFLLGGCPPENYSFYNSNKTASDSDGDFLPNSYDYCPNTPGLHSSCGCSLAGAWASPEPEPTPEPEPAPQPEPQPEPTPDPVPEEEKDDVAQTPTSPKPTTSNPKPQTNNNTGNNNLENNEEESEAAPEEEVEEESVIPESLEETPQSYTEDIKNENEDLSTTLKVLISLAVGALVTVLVGILFFLIAKRRKKEDEIDTLGELI